jgi:hypothetical protein
MTKRSGQPTPDTPAFNNGDTICLRYAKTEIGYIVGTLYLLGGSVQYMCNFPDMPEPKFHYEGELEIHEGYDS